MAADPRKRQKKLARRSAKRKAKHHTLVRQRSAGLAQRLTDAAGCPILDCWVNEELWSAGMGWVCLSRELPGGDVAFAIFLVDRYCLGVKNALADIVSRDHYDNLILGEMRGKAAWDHLSPEAARKLVETAVEYARGLGFPPHPDYHRTKHIFGAIDSAQCLQEFEFGKDGKPLFIAGPADSPHRCRQIVSSLERTRGPGGFHFVIPGDGSDGLISVDETDDGVHLLDMHQEDLET